MQKYKLARRRRTIYRDPKLPFICLCYDKGCYCLDFVAQQGDACTDCTAGTHVARNGKRFAVRD